MLYFCNFYYRTYFIRYFSYVYSFNFQTIFGKAYLFYTLGVCLPLHLFRVKSGFDNDDDGALIFFMCCDFILLILKEYIWMIKIGWTDIVLVIYEFRIDISLL